MPVRGSQDLATAILFVAVGLGAFFIGAGYPMGTPQRLGTGVLPRILAWCLMGTGALLLIKHQLRGQHRMSAGPITARELKVVTIRTGVNSGGCAPAAFAKPFSGQL